MKNPIDRHLPYRLLYSFIFGAVFIVVGYFVPKLYLEYLDETNYIEFVEPVSFDRKVYPPCDTAKALIKARILVDSATDSRYRLMLVRQYDTNEFEVVASHTTPGFIKKQEKIQTFVADYPIPCNLKIGTYLFRGDIVYKVRGIEKNYTFESQLFTINPNATILYPHNGHATPSALIQ